MYICLVNSFVETNRHIVTPPGFGNGCRPMEKLIGTTEKTAPTEKMTNILFSERLQL
jgi:hypothetical protein